MATSSSVRSDPACLDATLSDVVIHAGATEFVFELDIGTTLILRTPRERQMPRGSAALVGTATDGPAEANPDRLGRIHRLCFGEEAIEITLADR